ncbi:YciK family oxidoreductase [Neptuniibacter caesariensis]|uniref:Short chain dehydrogenase n=1 Tax=Neptuniibacter caesariensis TaxID=207954 RepID=A0A7U8C3H7_NEPCE|nr:YciK family oxidoreductase [Neptuniibacter caesariensis]EAR60813.1 short chain dehydrogenase [Oceanospirillum sp. MED92] [Neptuniibacter caesariensis]
MFEYQAPENLLKDRIILVTGAGDGIGRVAAKTFAAHGATVILLGRTLEKLEHVYDEIEAAGHPQPALVPLNLESAQEHDFIELTNTLEQEFGRIDGILHNASLLGVRTPIESYDPVIWQQVMQVNVNAPFMLTQILMPLLENSENPSIVFTSSSVGRKSKAYWGAYAVSKFATEGLMQTLADELSNISKIRVNCINPGATRTQMRADAYPGEDPSTVAAPEDIMPLYLYLMGSDSQETHGQSLDAQ